MNVPRSVLSLPAFGKHLLDLLYPPRCLSCNALTEAQDGLCAACWAKTDFIASPACAVCHHPFPYDVGEGALCGACIKEPPPYDAARSVFLYAEDSRKLITSFKYGDKTIAARHYARWMTRAAADIAPEADIVCPVPLHRWRLLKRKYNQSALLAHEIHRLTGVTLRQQLMVRRRHTPPQASLSKAERERNVKGCFAVNPKFRDEMQGKAVLLIDDVMTTGATIHECSKALKKAGASKVFVLTLARTLNHIA